MILLSAETLLCSKWKRQEVNWKVSCWINDDITIWSRKFDQMVTKRHFYSPYKSNIFNWLWRYSLIRLFDCLLKFFMMRLLVSSHSPHSDRQAVKKKSCPLWLLTIRRFPPNCHTRSVKYVPLGAAEPLPGRFNWALCVYCNPAV